MRFIKTFILRLYIDTDRREQICGDLQALPNSKSFPFKSEIDLNLLLQQFTDEQVVDSSSRNSQGERNCSAKPKDDK